MHHTHDMQIAAKAREELALHKIDMSRVEVSVERGIVTLSGVVANEVERQNAVTTVFAIPGVQNVKINLSLEDHTVGEYIDDTLLTTAVKGKLLAEAGIKSLSVSVETNQGVVTLTGNVDRAEHIPLAERIAKDVDGVKSVDNRLMFKP